MFNLLENKVCLVTGASRGIGAAIAKLFSDEGATVYGIGRNKGSINAPAIPIYLDITDIDELKKAFIRVKREQGRLDVLVNNAGITSNEVIGMIREETVETIFRTNVFAPLQALQLAARIMKMKKSGSIINMSSIVGTEGSAGETAYSGSKGAIISITKSSAKELAQEHIRVNCIAPGYTNTEMFNNAVKTDNDKMNIINNIRFGRLAEPMDIAKACLWLASDLSDYVTGQVIGVNGSSII